MPKPTPDKSTTTTVEPMFISSNDELASPSDVRWACGALNANPKTLVGRLVTSKRVAPSQTKFVKCFRRKNLFVV